ncbi:MAG TPA: TldD/PmbA family protein [Halanaerobiales bacterium]|nr:TldD/PmbA family protein [Halanaerobiales bacterium]
MKERFTKLLSKDHLDYGDIRFEKNNETDIRYEGNELKDIKETYREGGHIRIYDEGSKVYGSFSEVEDAVQTFGELQKLSNVAGDFQKEKISLKNSPVIKDKVKINPQHHPRDISLSDKKDLLKKYNELALKQDNVINTIFHYKDFNSKRIFVNSEGTVIEYELLASYIHGAIFAKKGDVVQIKGVSFGGFPEFNNLLNREEDLLEKVEILQKMLAAEPVKAGTYPIIVNPQLAAVLIHEAFGHLSEADIIKNNPSFIDKLQMGKKLGSEILNVIDDPTIKNTPGYYKYDDEGQPGIRTELIKDGILNGRLHSRETANIFSEPVTGNMRAVDCNHTPIIRMSNIFIDSGDDNLQDMINSIDKGYYLFNSKGGQTTGDQFTFGAEYGYKIVNGEKQEMVRDINISGELFKTLRNITMVGDDLTFNEVGGCGKGDPMQLNIFSGKGAPHIKIAEANIGGR